MMTKKLSFDELSKRERQIMDVIYQLGRATANEVMDGLPESPKNATVRKQLSILAKKGFLLIEQQDSNLHNRYYYVPAVPLEKARDGALDRLLSTFFQGSTSQAMIALLKKSEMDLSPGETAVFKDLIEKERKKGR
jgi:BlaI family transcriptional regulator, penicillinase repressor